jgi:CRISPR-associated Csx2 family protein
MKKLLTFLGTTNYVYVNYFLDNKKVESVRFVQQAIAEILCKEWSEEDKIIVFLTEEARKKNWEDGSYDEKGEPSKGLKTELSCLGLKLKIEEENIPEGKSEEEQWELFKKVLDKIDKNDEIYLDITHSFRSLPFLIMIVLNYAVNIKNAKIKGIYYGAVEVLGTPQGIRNMPKDKRNAPIFNLVSFVTLFDWTIATRRFIDIGDASLLQQLAQEELKPLLKETKGKKGKALETFSKLLGNLSHSYATCRAREIPKIILKIRENMDEAKRELPILPVFLPLIEVIEEKLNKIKFKEKGLEEAVNNAEWCLEHNLIQQGFTLLQEGIITYYLRQIDLREEEIANRVNREAVANAINCIVRKIDETDALKNFCHRDKLYSIIQSSKSIAEIFIQISTYRNDLNHAGWTADFHQPDDFNRKLKEFIQNLKEVQDV